MTGAMEGGNKDTEANDVFVKKYNKFVDSIYERINSILKKSYDPVNVRLSMEAAEMKTSNSSKKSNKK